MPDPEKIKRNVAKMAAAGASAEEIEAYIQSQGLQPIEQPEQAQAPAPKPETAGDRVRGLVMSGAQGASLGFADDILGGIAGAQSKLGGGSFSEGRDAYTSRFRGAQDQFRTAHPVASTAAEVVGGAIPAVGALPGVAGRIAPSALRRAGQMVKVGAGYGAAAGAGHAEGGVGERAAGAAVGGAIGAVAAPVLGATIPRAVGAAARGGNAVVNAVQRGAARMPGSPLTRSASDATATRGPSRTSRRAAGLWADAFERDRVPLESVRARGNRPTETPTMLMDMGKRNVRGRAEAATSIPSRAQEEIPAALWARQEGQSTRLLEGAQRDLGRGREFYSSADEALTALRTNAKPLYGRAYESAPEINDPRINELLELPAFQRAWKRAAELAKHEGVEIPERLVAEGDPALTEALRGQQRGPSLQVLDYVKRGLDDLIAGEEAPALTFGAKPRMSELGRSLTNLKNEFLGILDEAAPDYRAARAQYRGDREVITALEEGRSVLRAPHKQLARRWDQMSDAEREMYRVGSVEAMVEEAGRLRGTGADLTKRIWGPRNSNVRENIQLMFRGDPAGYRRFRTLLENESRGNQTLQAVTGNSATARRLAGQGDIAGVNAGEVSSTLSNAASGNLAGLGRQFIQTAVRRGVQGMTENVADELGAMGTARAGTQRFSDVLRQLEEAQRIRTSGRLNRYRSTAVSGSTLGGSSTRR